MWITTPQGFFSIVQVHDVPKRHVDANIMQIRARSRSHLEALKKATFVSLPRITSNGGTDYPYRIITTRERVGQVLIDLLVETNYSNFKDEATRVNGRDAAFITFLHKVWSLGLDLTPGRMKRRIGIHENTQPRDIHRPLKWGFPEVKKK